MSAMSELLAEWRAANIEPTLGKHEANHPATIRATVARLIESGDMDAASLIIWQCWWNLLVTDRANRFANELRAARGADDSVTETDPAILAAEYCNRLGIYAVPLGDPGKAPIAWRPLMPTGRDPELRWLIENRPTSLGWPTWQSAIIALGRLMDTFR